MKAVGRMVALSLGAIAVAALFVARALEVRADRDALRTSPAIQAVPVSVVPAARRDMVERVSVTGVIRPHNEVDIVAKLAGTINSVDVQVGDQVDEGRTLARLEHRELDLRRQQADAELDGAVASVERARTAVEAAAATFRRYEALRRDHATPDAEFERVQSAYREAQAAMTMAESQVATSRARLALIAHDLENATVVTPVAGTVTRRLVSVGVQVGPGTPLFQVQDTSTLKLEAAVPASDFARLHRGQVAEVTAEDASGAAASGRVSALSPTLNAETRRASVEIAISNRMGRLLPNMFARAVIDVARTAAVLTIPDTAIVATPSGRVVFVVRDGKAVEVHPALGATDAGLIAITSGLEEHDPVVVAGQSTLRDGAVVTAVPLGVVLR